MLKKYYFIFIVFLSVFISCTREKLNETYSVAIITSYGTDPLNPSIYEKYSSGLVCNFGFEVTDDRIEFYKHNKNGRFIATVNIENDSLDTYRKLVKAIYSKVHRGRFNDTNFTTNRIYCGATFIPCIKNKDSITRKLIAESLKNPVSEDLLRTMEHASFSDTIDYYKDLNWSPLGNNEFPEYIISAEQYGNIQLPLPKQAPMYKVKKFFPPKAR